MTENQPPPSPDDLDARLKMARAKQAKASGDGAGRAGAASGMGLALRMGIDFVSAVVIGVGIGLLLDWWWGSKPWMMVLFVLLGAAAGTANVVRTASGYDASIGFRQKPDDGEKEDDGDHGGPRHKD